jgi:hypothetical protein
MVGHTMSQPTPMTAGISSRYGARRWRRTNAPIRTRAGSPPGSCCTRDRAECSARSRVDSSVTVSQC